MRIHKIDQKTQTHKLGIIPSMRFTPARRLRLIGLLTGIVLILVALMTVFRPPIPSSGAESSPTVEPTAQPTSWISPDVNEPFLPANSSLADKGAVKYWGVCMACHGDRGQGLTDEWRKRAFGEDMNCWVSKCHAANHPPQGFSLVRFIPPVIGPNTLQRFITAADLHDYLLAKMPWWNPGSLSSNEAWQLTAFLLREDGIYPYSREFNPAEAASISVHLPYHTQTEEKVGEWIFTGCISAIMLLLVADQTRRRRKESVLTPDRPPLASTEDSTVERPNTDSNTDAAIFTGFEHASPTEDPANAAREPGMHVPSSAVTSIQPAHSRPNFLHHLHPPSIPLPQARFRYTLGTGGIAVFLCMLLAITGTLEMFFYIATPQQAGSSIQVITFLVPFGGLIRGLHFWAAQVLVVVSAIHLLRILFTGAYIQPRRFNYLLGLGLFVVALLFDFTGYILRWDEGIRWALMVGTNLVKTIPVIGNRFYAALIGGASPGLATLTRFYTWHIFGLTIVMGVVLVWHLFRVRRDGGISAPPPSLRVDKRRITRYELVQREVIAMLVAGLALLLVSLLWRVPLSPAIQANNNSSQALTNSLSEVRAPWFFLWIQQLLRYGNAFWLGVALPLAVLVLLAAIPYLFPHLSEEQRGRWFPSGGRAVQIIGGVLAICWIVLTILELATKTP